MEEQRSLEELMSHYVVSEEEDNNLTYDDIMNQQSDNRTVIEESVDLNSRIVPPEIIQRMREKPPYIDEMMQKIEDMEAYAQSRGSMGLDFGIESLNQAFNGLNPGLTIFAGGANTGK